MYEKHVVDVTNKEKWHAATRDLETKLYLTVDKNQEQMWPFLSKTDKLIFLKLFKIYIMKNECKHIVFEV